MTIKLPPTHVQGLLLDVPPDKPISRNGEARTRYGAAVNEIVNALLGLEDIPNSGSHDCVFDAYHRPSSCFVEVKSLRVRNKLVVYDWRLKKDEAAGVPLAYVIAVHNCRDAGTLANMWQQMSDTLDTIYVFPAAVISRLAMAEPLQKIGSHKTPSGGRNGYQRAGYKEGYRNIPWAKVADAPMQGGRLRLADLHGLRFTANVFFHRTLTPWLD